MVMVRSYTSGMRSIDTNNVFTRRSISQGNIGTADISSKHPCEGLVFVLCFYFTIMAFSSFQDHENSLQNDDHFICCHKTFS